ncbi:hypothetical protein QI30_17730 [Kurthia sp. 3B1D]|uniref:Peptidase n=1 Tax=Candidatus Kurthia intestinigallinarum TaxID=1562256 RepID=A0A433RQI7_9BACL|nr:metal-binding protein [Kurthia sp. 3B1D]RUS52604.1 hypothetical protein QI30_17730 [Kurthia sp. 3B1D]
MSSGKTHDRVNSIFITLLVLVLFFYNLINDVSILYFVLGFMVGTFYLGPDLDLRSNLYYRWGALRFIWHPYQNMLSHRSVWSHFPLISDIIRYIWIGMMYSVFFLSPYIISKYILETMQYMNATYLLLTIGVLLYVTATKKKLPKKYRKKRLHIDFGSVVLLLFILNSVYVLMNGHPFFMELKDHELVQELERLWDPFSIFFLGNVLATTLHSLLDMLSSGVKKLKK